MATAVRVNGSRRGMACVPGTQKLLPLPQNLMRRLRHESCVKGEFVCVCQNNSTSALFRLPGLGDIINR